MSEPRKTADTITDNALDQLYAERDRLRTAILDIDAHATPIGQADPQDPDGNPHHYVVTVGALHRALGKVGHTAPLCTAEAERDRAYRERAHLVALLAAMTDGAVIAPALDLDEPGWWITYLNIGGRQASWHISPRDAGLFRGVERVEPDDPRAQWDGHTTDEKYAGIAAWTTAMAQTRGPIASPLRAQCEATVRMILAGTGAHTVDEWAEYVTAAILPIFRTRIDELRRERDLAIAHDRQPYPTAWAYEQACTGLHAHRDRAELLDATLREALAAFNITVRQPDGRVLGHYAEAPIHPDDMARWHAVLDQTKEQPMPTSDTPPCTATIEGPHVLGGGPVRCTRKAGHTDTHIGPNPNGERKTLWGDHHAGATPHQASSGEQR